MKIHFAYCPYFFAVFVISSGKTIKGNQKHSALNLGVPEVLLLSVFPVGAPEGIFPNSLEVFPTNWKWRLSIELVKVVL